MKPVCAAKTTLPGSNDPLPQPCGHSSEEDSPEEDSSEEDSSEEEEEDYRDLEYAAWCKYEAALKDIRRWREESLTPDETKADSLAALISSMVSWKRRVERGDDDIPTKCWNAVMSSIEIMTDCGDTVVKEMEWYVATARKIVDKGDVFEWTEPTSDGEEKMESKKR
eukprot:CAMPEP_0170178518 /NCGR_PEP_ID=MMETSP0040_2-20121228/11937_1 /TAXON_ID=641309 /ORGANISM="Lotharella oceanica, Strain CCMP622" /LENGTH=166 /DNA_ID=CAMNT_0010421603 /DNA_START=81 /DNA_END=581 /DNA_ORIENTATION=-